MNVNKYDGSELILALSKELKKVPECEMPEWAMFVKTGVSKTRTPMDSDWWYVRSASILRKVAILGPIGVNKLKVKYGSKYRRGYKPSKFQKGSGKIIRVILQQLEQSGMIKQIVVSGHKGRVLDTKAIKLLASVSKTLVVETVVEEKVVKVKDSVAKTEDTPVKETKAKSTKPAKSKKADVKEVKEVANVKDAKTESAESKAPAAKEE